MKRLLIVDDEINVLHALQRTLRQHLPPKELRIEIYTTPQQALERCVEVAFDVIISDYNMPEMNGIDFLKTAKLIQPDAIRLMLSASSEFKTVMSAVNEAEVFRYICKPWQKEELEETIRLALAHKNQVMEDRHLADEVRVQRGALTPQELEAKRLEEQEPGITKVNWGTDGAIYLD
jgi:two-component system, probable response regulator PhcQ